MKKTRIKITHQLEKTVHHFLVVNPNKLSCDEVNRICDKMNVTSLFINGKLYKT
jgi:hypothetical protein